jgi:hypothetical protein
MPKVYFAFQIEGATGTLKAIDGAILGDRYLCHSVTTEYGPLTHIYDADSGLPESIPEVVSPATSAGLGRWILNPAE